mmetsp:Transcript_59025/g.103766  ORF Transcript_59025/g.103766 Transcript_59025/m.103766 type:complete len:318 (-) Transcript_59025:940-1893(-)
MLLGSMLRSFTRWITTVLLMCTGRLSAAARKAPMAMWSTTSLLPYLLLSRLALLLRNKETVHLLYRTKLPRSNRTAPVLVTRSTTNDPAMIVPSLCLFPNNSSTSSSVQTSTRDTRGRIVVSILAVLMISLISSGYGINGKCLLTLRRKPSRGATSLFVPAVSQHRSLPWTAPLRCPSCPFLGLLRPHFHLILTIPPFLTITITPCTTHNTTLILSIPSHILTPIIPPRTSTIRIPAALLLCLSSYVTLSLSLNTTSAQPAQTAAAPRPLSPPPRFPMRLKKKPPLLPRKISAPWPLPAQIVCPPCRVTPAMSSLTS